MDPETRPAAPEVGAEGRLGPALLVLACLVGLDRFWRLGDWSLWIDEVYTLTDTLHRDDLANPLGYWLYSLVLPLAPGRPDEWWLRILPAAIGWLSIPAVYVAFRRAAGALPAGAAALVLASSSWHLYWSQTARFYTLALVLSLLGSGAVLAALRTGRVGQLAAGLGLAAAAGTAHPSGVFVLPGLVVGPLLVERVGGRFPGLDRRMRWVLLAFGALGAVAGAGWLWGVWAQWQETLKSPNPAHFVLTTGFYVTPIVGAAAAYGALDGWLRRDPGALLAAVVAGSALVVATVASVTARASAQYVFVLLPWLAVLATWPLGRAPLVGRAVWAYGALLVLPLLASSALYFTSRAGERPRWKEAYRYVWSHREPGDQVFGMAAPVGEYYLTNRTDVRQIQRQVSWLDTFRAEAPSAWARYDRPAWFVVNREELEDWARDGERAAFERLLDEDCELVASFPVNLDARDIDVLVYRRD